MDQTDPANPDLGSNPSREVRAAFTSPGQLNEAVTRLIVNRLRKKGLDGRAAFGFPVANSPGGRRCEGSTVRRVTWAVTSTPRRSCQRTIRCE
jgi:hypothetical protein